MFRMPTTQAAMRLMLASKKSSPINTLSRYRSGTSSVASSLSLIIQLDDMVAVPADRAADMQGQLIIEQQHR